MRRLEALRGGWGVLLLVAPEYALRRIGGVPDPDRKAVVVTRVLGGRQSVQALLSGSTPSPAVMAVGVWVDGIHALTAGVLAATDRRRRRTAGLDAVIAAAWAELGRRDIARFTTGRSQ